MSKTQEQPAPAAQPKRHRAKVRTPINSSMRLLDIQDVCDFTRLSEKTVERMLDKDEFPKPMMLTEDSGRCRRWTLASIEQWIRRRSEAAA